MERLTTNKSVSDMSMVELAHNSCYVDSEGNARYRDYEMEMDARDFARNLMVTLTKDELPVDDAEFDEEILDNLTIDPFSDVRGLIAMFYRNMWAMADLREKLKRDEDAEEQGLLLRLPAPLNGVESFSLDGKTTWYRLPCRIGDTVYQITKDFISEYQITSMTIYPYSIQFNWECTKGVYKNVVGFAGFEIGKTVFLTREEAESKLKEMEEERDVL